MADKNRFYYLLEYLAARGLFEALKASPSALPGRAVGRLAGRVVASRSRRAEENLRAAFPQEDKRTIRRWVGECWANLGEALWEFTRIPALSPEDYFRLVRVEGLERLRASHAAGKGVILFTAHYTNWELTTQFVVFSGFPLAVIARRIKNPYVDAFINRVRAHFNVKVFLHKNAVRESMRWLKQGNVLGLLIDQRITDGGLRTPFFGRPAHTTGLPALLALRQNVPVHPVHVWREDGRLRLRVDPAMDFSGLSAKESDIAEATARMNAVVESWVRENPPLWLWIHDRWK
ncbi:MAG: lysophospholipid acyltransferase family protein [Elusimicrobiota bacterium]